ncbi:conserved alanine and leucine rich protein [Mycobacteroides abscessus subsp. massiliense]|nr:conserved alanine and leucine rich protein [Mycobacteroides abscessus subsp. massiliense]
MLRRGAVTVVNSLGSGVLENPGLARFLPDLSRRLLDEPLALSGGQSWWGGIDTERSHLLANLASLLVKSTAGEEVYTGPLETRVPPSTALPLKIFGSSSRTGIRPSVP